MKQTIILKAFGDVDDFDPRGFLKVATVNDKLVGAEALVVGVEYFVISLKTTRHVVSVQNGCLRRLSRDD